jgi:hypothetical protein
MASGKPTRWAVEQFGDSALDVAKYVIMGLRRGQRAARIVQAVAQAEGATHNHPFGSMWTTRYQVIVEQFDLADLPGFEVIKPKGASYRLAVINGRVLIPFRHASSTTKPIGQAKLGSLIPRRIARESGVLPERTLFDEPNGLTEDAKDSIESPTVREVAADARALNLTVVYIGYVANADSDEVLAAWWGTPISLEDDGSMVWSPERLDLTVNDYTIRAEGIGLNTVSAAEEAPGFAQGAEPELKFTPRPRKAELPQSEPEPSTPDTAAETDE